MQETPNYHGLKSQFNGIILMNLIDGREKIEEPFRSKISTIYRDVELYFKEDKFRSKLDIGTRNALEAQIGNIISQFNQIMSWQNDGSTLIANQIHSTISNLDSYINEYTSRISAHKQLYDLQDGRNISEIVDSAQEKEQLAKQTVKELTKKLAEADKLLGEVGSNDLADYYQRQSNGRTVNEHIKSGGVSRKVVVIPGGLKAYLLLSIILYILIDWLWNLIDRHDFTMRQYITIGFSVALPIGIYISIKIVNTFNRVFNGGFLRTAYLWMIGAITSTISTAVYAAILVAELDSDAGWQNIVPKLVGLLAPAYFVRFCVQNYRANMHLSVQDGQKATVARVAESFSDLIRHNNPDYAQQVLAARSEIILAAAKVVFAPSETGFLTRKEGAGGGDDNMLEGLININK